MIWRVPEDEVVVRVGKEITLTPRPAYDKEYNAEGDALQIIHAGRQRLQYRELPG